MNDFMSGVCVGIDLDNPPGADKPDFVRRFPVVDGEAFITALAVGNNEAAVSRRALKYGARVIEIDGHDYINLPWVIADRSHHPAYAEVLTELNEAVLAGETKR